ncbi:hypothetical protein SO802_027205 [Lithocarpus litseifolius]|uniref:Uncharacterized protein n=1 Tax=Lithocarpus litseifolius TaxID=425828 RepID=A0AAW2C7J6_9ROSI
MASRSQSQAELEKVGKEGFAIIDKYFYGRPRRPPEVWKICGKQLIVASISSFQSIGVAKQFVIHGSWVQSEEPLAPFLRNPTSVTELLDLAFEMDVQLLGLACSKWRDGSCDLGEGLAHMVPKVEGTA